MENNQRPMLPLTTPVILPKGLPRLSHADHLLALGSCFATEMGQRLTDGKFRCDINPFGVLYNPHSIATALRQIAEGRSYTEADLFAHNGLWHSPMHHGDFSTGRVEETLSRINHRLGEAAAHWSDTTHLLLTWGTAWVYEERESGRIVGNCHKLPDRCFHRRRLTVDEIATTYNELMVSNPWLQVLLTVSPIRHLRDGLHDNQLSKATLLLAADELQRRFPDRVSYFPAYEILLDELRDYRFYADDMLHPTPLAVEYIWRRFADACFTTETQQVIAACDEVRRLLSHRPLHPDGEEYKRFLGQIVLKIEQLSRKYPYLALEKEKELCRTRLNPLQK